MGIVLSGGDTSNGLGPLKVAWAKSGQPKLCPYPAGRLRKVVLSQAHRSSLSNVNRLGVEICA